jgi:hypothetical protein
MNRGTLRQELSFLLNAEENAADQAFNTSRLNKAIDQAYEREWERAKLHANGEFSKMYQDGLTWPASQLRLVLPESLASKTIIDIYDITSGEPGAVLISKSNYTWADRGTLQWVGTTGPGSAKSLRVYYEAVAEPLINDDAVPVLIPPQFHQLLVWSAGCQLRAGADERMPPDWVTERDDLRLDCYKHLSRGKPLSAPPVMGGQGGVGDASGTSEWDADAPAGLNTFTTV